MLTTNEFIEKVKKISTLLKVEIIESDLKITYANETFAYINMHQCHKFIINSEKVNTNFIYSNKCDELFLLIKIYAATPIDDRTEKLFTIELRSFKYLKYDNRYVTLQLKDTNSRAKDDLYFAKLNKNKKLKYKNVFTQSELNELKSKYKDWFEFMGNDLVYTQLTEEI